MTEPDLHLAFGLVVIANSPLEDDF